MIDQVVSDYERYARFRLVVHEGARFRPELISLIGLDQLLSEVWVQVDRGIVVCEDLLKRIRLGGLTIGGQS